MNEEEKKKWQYMVEQANHLLLIPSAENADALFACVGLASVVSAIGKETTVLATNEAWFKQFPFLHGWPHVKQGLEPLRNFIISIHPGENGVRELHYERVGDEVKVHVRPRRKNISPQDVSFSYGGHAFDLIVTVGIEHLDKLGPIAQSHQELFQASPIVNLHSLHAERFGELNIIKPGAMFAEMAFDLTTSIEEALLTPEACNQLLCSVVLATDCFMNERSSPAVARLAAELIESGGSMRKTCRLLGFEGIQQVTQPPLSGAKIPPQSMDILPTKQGFERKEERTPDIEVEIVEEPIETAVEQARIALPQKGATLLVSSKTDGAEAFPCAVLSRNKEALSLLEEVLNGATTENAVTFTLPARSIDEAKGKLSRLAEVTFG